MLNSKHILALSIMGAVTITSLGIAIRSYRHEPTTRTTHNMQSWGISDDTPFTVMRRKPDTVIPTAVGNPGSYPNDIQAPEWMLKQLQSSPTLKPKYYLVSYLAVYNGEVSYGNTITQHYGYLSDTSLRNYLYSALKCENPNIPKRNYQIMGVSEVTEWEWNNFYAGAKEVTKFVPCPDKPVSHAMLIEAPVQFRYYDTIPVEFRHSPEDTMLLLTPDKH